VADQDNYPGGCFGLRNGRRLHKVRLDTNPGNNQEFFLGLQMGECNLEKLAPPLFILLFTASFLRNK
jgi:hypothetical protein